MHLFESPRRPVAITAAVVVSLALHVALGLGIDDVDRESREQGTVIHMAIKEEPAHQPKPPPKVAPDPPPASKAKSPLKPKVRRLAAKAESPPPSNKTPDPEKPPPTKPVFGVSMNSTVTAGGSRPAMSVQVGNTLAMAPAKSDVSPEDVRPYEADPAIREKHGLTVLPSYKLTEMPTPRKLVKADYPERARVAGIEGEIIMRLTIDEEGKVRAVTIVRGLGHGLDELARNAAHAFLFDPARVEGTPVATVIPFTYRWEIVD
jgi:protein TonB